MTPDKTQSTPTLRHLALFYRGVDEYVAAIARFLHTDLRAGDRTLILVPRQNSQALRIALKECCDSAVFADMQAIGRNPARIGSALEAFIAAGSGRARIIGEPIWPGRSRAEVREATRHEALINLAFAAADATIVCPYDAAQLPGAVIADARRTHPALCVGDARVASPAYQGPDAFAALTEPPLPAPPPSARVLVFRDDLRVVRSLVAEHADLAGLRPTRAADLVLAVSELAANTLVHTGRHGTLRVWRTADEVICQVDDVGHITDPLAGRRLPDPEMTGGHGLWLVNQCCDLTQLCTSTSGTTIRLHMRLADV